jgi:PAS domain-containing protein
MSAEAGRHKRILISVRLLFGVLLGALALPGLLKGGVPAVLPIILLAYLGTSAAMVWESGRVFHHQRIQAGMLLFDIFVLVLAMATLEQYRQELFLAMFLVVLLASAGQRLSVSIAGYVAVAAVYTGFTLKGDGSDGLGHLAVGLPVLLVVAIYVGYVTETVARERRRRQEVEAQLHLELRGMNRIQALAGGVLSDLDPGCLFEGIASTAGEMLGAPYAGVFWIPKGGSTFEAAAPSMPQALLQRWRNAPADAAPLGRALQSSGGLRLSGPELAALGLPPEAPLDELLLAPLMDRVGGMQGCLLLGFPPPHAHLPAEEEAVQLLVQQAGLLLENATLYRMLSQTRDIWQSAFQSIPTPVVIVDGKARIVQVNPAFLHLGEFDFVNIIGSSFAEVLAGATLPNGQPAAPEEGSMPAFDAARITIPRLNGEFDVSRGPYVGSTDTGSGTVWVLRRVSEEVAAG